MDYNFIVTYTPMFLKALLLTTELAVASILISIVVGLVCAICYDIKYIKWIVYAYVEISRNTPLLIQLFFLYYGLPNIGIHIGAFSCAVIALSFLGGSYMSETFRLGLEGVKKSQIEAGLSLALDKQQVFRYVIFPQAFRISLPSFSANVIFLIKETSVVSVIALADLLYAAKDLIGLYYKTDESLLMLVIGYAIIILPISLFLTYFEKRLSYARS